MDCTDAGHTVEDFEGLKKCASLPSEFLYYDTDHTKCNGCWHISSYDGQLICYEDYNPLRC
jgi:hypothetical protein